MSDASSDTMHEGLPPKHPFWSKKSRGQGKETAGNFFKGLGLITIWLWIVLPIFWGSVWLLLNRVSYLTVLVVDFESPVLGNQALVGPAIIEMAQMTNMEPKSMSQSTVQRPVKQVAEDQWI